MGGLRKAECGHLAGVCSEQAEQNAGGGCLASAVGADDAKAFAWKECQVEAAEGCVPAEPLGHTLHQDERCAAASISSC
jgi:hypothetical protein